MKRVFSILFVGLGLLMVACNSEPDPEYVYPKSYLPAYPGSKWVYSNGEILTVATEYQKHQFETSVSSTKKSDAAFVPKLGSEYLYEYEITQNSNVYPLKKLLQETRATTSGWVVNDYKGLVTMRTMVPPPDSLVITFYGEEKPKDSVFKKVFTVVEYLEELGQEQWSKKEYYVENIGLVMVEIQDASDTLPQPVLYKTLIDFDIKKNQ